MENSSQNNNDPWNIRVRDFDGPIEEGTDPDIIWKKVRKQIRQPRRNKYKFYLAAACAVSVIVFAVAINFSQRHKNQQPAVVKHAVPLEIHPVENKVDYVVRKKDSVVPVRQVLYVTKKHPDNIPSNKDANVPRASDTAASHLLIPTNIAVANPSYTPQKRPLTVVHVHEFLPVNPDDTTPVRFNHLHNIFRNSAAPATGNASIDGDHDNHPLHKKNNPQN